MNSWGLWAYLLLWAMHLRARLNVFLGVRNVSEEFVPAHMAVLKSFLTRKPMNLLFPFSITAATIGAVLLFQQAFSADLAEERAGWSLLAALAALAVFEHWMLMLPRACGKAVEMEPARPPGRGEIAQFHIAEV